MAAGRAHRHATTSSPPTRPPPQPRAVVARDRRAPKRPTGESEEIAVEARRRRATPRPPQAAEAAEAVADDVADRTATVADADADVAAAGAAPTPTPSPTPAADARADADDRRRRRRRRPRPKPRSRPVSDEDADEADVIEELDAEELLEDASARHAADRAPPARPRRRLSRAPRPTTRRSRRPGKSSPTRTTRCPPRTSRPPKVYLARSSRSGRSGQKDIDRALDALERAFRLDIKDAEVRAELERVGGQYDRWDRIVEHLPRRHRRVRADRHRGGAAPRRRHACASASGRRTRPRSCTTRSCGSSPTTRSRWRASRRSAASRSAGRIWPTSSRSAPSAPTEALPLGPERRKRLRELAALYEERLERPYEAIDTLERLLSEVAEEERSHGEAGDARGERRDARGARGAGAAVFARRPVGQGRRQPEAAGRADHRQASARARCAWRSRPSTRRSWPVPNARSRRTRRSWRRDARRRGGAGGARSPERGARPLRGSAGDPGASAPRTPPARSGSSWCGGAPSCSKSASTTPRPRPARCATSATEAIADDELLAALLRNLRRAGLAHEAARALSQRIEMETRPAAAPTANKRVAELNLELSLLKLDDLNDPAAARKEVEAALEAAPENPAALAALAQLHLKAERLRRLRRDPPARGARAARAVPDAVDGAAGRRPRRLASRCKSPDKARACFEEALERGARATARRCGRWRRCSPARRTGIEARRVLERQLEMTRGPGRARGRADRPGAHRLGGLQRRRRGAALSRRGAGAGPRPPARDPRHRRHPLQGRPVGAGREAPDRGGRAGCAISRSRRRSCSSAWPRCTRSWASWTRPTASWSRPTAWARASC